MGVRREEEELAVVVACLPYAQVTQTTKATVKPMVMMDGLNWLLLGNVESVVNEEDHGNDRRGSPAKW